MKFFSFEAYSNQIFLFNFSKGFRMLPRSCMVQLKSLISGHESINSFMSKKFKEVELEKVSFAHFFPCFTRID